MDTGKVKTIALLLATVFAISTRGQQVEKLVVHFAFNKSDLQTEAKNLLDSLLQANKNKYTFTGIQIDAHCDSVGNNSYNDNLSNKRASSVKNYLTNAGMPVSVLTEISGHG